MKKFITYIALQNISPARYRVHDEKHRNLEVRTEENGEITELFFPIVASMYANAEKGEKIKVLAVHDKRINDPDYKEIIEGNKKKLTENIEKIKLVKGFEYEIEYLEISDVQTSQNHLKTFLSLMKKTEDDDVLYLDISYGNKPTPIVEILALQGAYSLKSNVMMGGIYYGEKLFNKDDFYIYDITPLFNMSRMVERLAPLNYEEALEIIENSIRPYVDDEGEKDEQ